MSVITAPETLPEPPENRSFIPDSLFLAGTIEQGQSFDWQQTVIDYISKRNSEAVIFNPRRKQWDSSWKQDISNPQFKEQVTWELDALDLASVILMYFDPATKSPISLLELGLYASSGKLLVVCPDGFWRKGNVQIVCARYNITLFNSLDELFLYIDNGGV